jgi:hypothetical protein
MNLQIVGASNVVACLIGLFFALDRAFLFKHLPFWTRWDASAGWLSAALGWTFFVYSF